MKKLNNVLTVDPGNYTGWAFWKGTLHPETGSFTFPYKCKDRISQILILADIFSSKIYTLQSTDFFIEKVIIEEVSIWEKSMTSMAAAKRGNLFKLSMLIGSYILVCSKYGIKVDLVKPNTWKGQLNDEAVKVRVNMITNQTYANVHIYSAVGIGLNEIGIFKDMGLKNGH